MNKSKRHIVTAVMTFALVAFFWLLQGKDVSAAGNYSVMVNVDANVITVYEDGVPIKAMICSTGPDTPREGTFGLKEKYRWGDLYHNVYGQYCSRITGHILFHSVPYSTNGDVSSQLTGSFDKLGTAASMGCVRLTTADAKWIFENCPSGTPVTFYTDPVVASPLGRPFFAGVSGVAGMNGWDPTDPDPANPWNKYLGKNFDANYYLTNNPDLLNLTSYWDENTLKLHYLTTGIREGRSAAKFFDFNTFKILHPELATIIGEDNYAYIERYNNYLAEEEALFDPVFYSMTYPDVAIPLSNDPQALKMHYLNYGIMEGRRGHA